MPGSRARPTASLLLLIAGLLCILAGTTALYARQQVLDADRLADRATRTLEDSDVRDAAARKLTDEAIAKIDPDLVTAKPLLQAATAALIGTDPFRSAFGRGVESAYDSVIAGNDAAVVTIANLGVLLDQAVRQFQPQLAKKIPKGLDSTLVKVGEGGVSVDAAQAVEDVRHLGLVLPPLGILLLAGAIALAGDRRRAAIRAGAGIAVIGLVAVVALVVVHDVIAAGIEDDTNRGAFDAVWDEFLQPLRNWYLLLGGFGLVVASAASSALGSRDLGPPLRRAWERIATEPESIAGRLLWALLLGGAGLVMVLKPLLALEIVIVIAGAYVISRALATVLSLVQEPAAAEESRRERRRILAWAGSGIAVAAVAAMFLVAVLSGEDPPDQEVTADPGCNGMKALCGRDLDRVAFPATHNSYAGANYPGFLFPEQDNTIPQQLQAGIRGLWIDTYYGVPGRRVYTDTSKLDPALIAQINQELGPKFAAAGARIRSQIAKPPAGAETRIYLCHGFCELGAVDAEKTFREIAQFLDQNPREVLVIDLEDYTSPEDTQEVIEEAGLAEHVYKGPQGPPWPTLEEMIDSGGRVLLVAEHMTGGADWYRPLNSTIQETPFEFKTPSEMTCKGGRGDRSDAILLINNWIGTDPTPKPSNARIVNGYRFLLDRARRCQRQRGRFPNILNVDFYLQGDLFGAVKKLNAEG